MLLIILIAKILGVVSKILGVGSGTTLPGLFVSTIYPQFLNKSLKQFSKGLVYVTGTNGKTSTTSYISGYLSGSSLFVITNETGSNLQRGVVSSIVANLSFFGNTSFQFGVFEVDEGASPAFLKNCFPDIILFLNLSRDQLDRYGEPDITLEKIARVLNTSPKKVIVFYNAHDPFLSKLPILANNPNLIYKKLPKRATFTDFNKEAASNVLCELGFDKPSVSNYLQEHTPVFGRGESFSYGSALVKILLAKNPASFNENLKLILNSREEVASTLVFILNDNIPDGKDISWIYDIDAKLLNKCCLLSKGLVFVTGTRAWDFGLRLILSGIPSDRLVVDTDLSEIQRRATTLSKNVIVLPTYSAMLETRKFFLGKKI